MKNTCNKGLLIPWLLKALNEQLYEGLKWSDKQRKIFYITWTHKSAEQWSRDVLEPFKAWAAHKGKLVGKNEKQLKATFRCALNSKKDELREVYRNRSQRYWQFVEPKSEEGKSDSKKKRKLSNKLENATSVGASNDSVSNTFMNSSSSTVDSNDFCKSPEEKTSKKKKSKVNRTLGDDYTPSASPHDDGNASTNSLTSVSSCDETENSTTAKLPPFQSIHSFQSLTPPYQDNEISFSSTEYSLFYNTPPSDASRLTPPVDIPPKNYHNTSHYDSFHHEQLSTDVWQPNCWSISPARQDFNSLNKFFLNDFDDISKSTNQELDSNKMDFLEKDQFVPVMNMNDQTLFRSEQFNYTSKSPYENNQCEQVKLEDYIFATDFNSEECERVMQELKGIPSSLEPGTYNYSS